MRVTNEVVTKYAHIIASVKVFRQLFNDQTVRQVLCEFSRKDHLLAMECDLNFYLPSRLNS